MCPETQKRRLQLKTESMKWLFETKSIAAVAAATSKKTCYVKVEY